jgi:hypothetical protein
MTDMPKDDELTVAATAAPADEPAWLTVTHVVVAALIGVAALALLTFMGSQFIGLSLGFFEDCTTSSSPLCGGFSRLWLGDPPVWH